jgi:hypothetical protein
MCLATDCWSLVNNHIPRVFDFGSRFPMTRRFPTDNRKFLRESFGARMHLMPFAVWWRLKKFECRAARTWLKR